MRGIRKVERTRKEQYIKGRSISRYKNKKVGVWKARKNERGYRNIPVSLLSRQKKKKLIQ